MDIYENNQTTSNNAKTVRGEKGLTRKELGRAPRATHPKRHQSQGTPAQDQWQGRLRKGQREEEGAARVGCGRGLQQVAKGHFYNKWIHGERKGALRAPLRPDKWQKMDFLPRGPRCGSRGGSVGSQRGRNTHRIHRNAR